MWYLTTLAQAVFAGLESDEDEQAELRALALSVAKAMSQQLRSAEHCAALEELAVDGGLEVDVKEKLKLMLAGGILAPSHKRSARFSDVQRCFKTAGH